MFHDFSDVLQLAVKVRDYVRDRAKVEKMGFDLPVDMFIQAIMLNASMFGVHHDGKEMLWDEQEPHPGYFKEWVKANTLDEPTSRTWQPEWN